jgi:hypothetical protein
VARPWRNFEQATGNLGGPIIRNKTHFFVLYDQKWVRTREAVNSVVLTPCAQRGIFRYYDNWTNGNSLAATNAGSTTPTISVVDRAGNPRPPATNPNGTPHNGILRYASVYGPLQNTPARSDCSDAVVGGNPWDPNRTGFDATGFVQNVLFKYMPAVNNYDVGDGLNTAGGRWIRTLKGADNLWGIGRTRIESRSISKSTTTSAPLTRSVEPGATNRTLPTALSPGPTHGRVKPGGNRRFWPSISRPHYRRL